VGCGAVRVEVGRRVVALDDGHGAAGSGQAVENRQGLNGTREVLQDETDEDMIERFRGEGHGKDVRLVEPHIGDSRGLRRPLGFRERVCGDVNGRESCVRASLG
jgi:hypothetical protein